MSVPNTFASATSAIPLANLDADFAYYDAAFQIVGTVMEVNYTFRLEDPTDNTKKAEFVMSGITTGTTRQYTMPNASGTLATLANTSQTFLGSTIFAPSTNSGIITIGGIPQTGTVTLGRSTASQTIDIAVGATAAASTKTVNIGTTGVSTSITNINYGSSVTGALVTHIWNAGANNMRLDSSGNLGIGTTSPALKLHVVSASAAVSYFETSDTATGAYVIWRNSSTSIGDVGSGKGISGSGNATDFMIASRSTYPLLFGTGSAERARIDSSGNVGIGTSSPAEKLDVRGGNIVGGNGTIKTVISYATTGIVGTLSNHALSIYTNSVEVARIDTSGNVGIGTTSPTAQLTLSSATANTNGIQLKAAGWNYINRLGQNGTSGDLVYWSNNYNFAASTIDSASYGTSYVLQNASSGFISFGTATTNTAPSERMRIDPSGNVGIGTTSPQSLLDLTGNDPTLRFTDNAGSPASTFSIRSTDGTLKFRDVTNSSDRVTIDSSGNLLVISAAGLGYGTGSGGTVTQATSKSTGVTLNKPTGQITMNNAALAGNTTVSFALSNTLLAEKDNVILNITNASAGGGTGGGNYNMWATPYAGGTNIWLKNISAGSLSEALVINFSIIKGATS